MKRSIVAPTFPIDYFGLVKYQPRRQALGYWTLFMMCLSVSLAIGTLVALILCAMISVFGVPTMAGL